MAPSTKTASRCFPRVRKVETQRGGVACPRSHSLEKTQMGLKPGLDFLSSAPFRFPCPTRGPNTMRTEPLLLPSPPPGICVPALPCRSKQADGKEEGLGMGPGGVSFGDNSAGLGLGTQFRHRQAGGSVGACIHPHLTGPHAHPRADSAWLLSVDLPVWWADKETDHCDPGPKSWGGRRLTSPQGQGGLSGGGYV